MAQQVVNESSGNAQNVLILSLLLLFINDILDRYANETSYEDYEEDYEDDYDDDYEDNYDDNYDEGYKDDDEDDSVSDKKKSASLVRLYGLLALWAICLVLCWMLFYVLIQDPLAEDPSSTCSLLMTNVPLSMFTAKPISCMDHQILMLILLDLFTIIIYYEQRVATPYLNAAMSRSKLSALLVNFVMSAMSILVNVFLSVMRYYYQKTLVDRKIIICLLIIEKIMMYMMTKMKMT